MGDKFPHRVRTPPHVSDLVREATDMSFVLITGDRNWKDSRFILDVLRKRPITKVINGACRGADNDSSWACRQLSIPYEEVPADWKTYGKAAGPIRNREMLKRKPDEVLAFHDDFENSKGTKDMCQAAKQVGIPVTLFSHHTNPEGILL